MQKFLWQATVVSSLLAIIVFIIAEIYSTTILQQITGAAIAIALAVIPYVLARAVQEIKNIK